MPVTSGYNERRHAMVADQIAARGVRSELVLAAMRSVPREEFVLEHLREFAYDDSPLPILAGQTISQPYIVALMVDALGIEGGEKVLEIGAGSGYAAAVIAEIADEVYTVESIERLASHARATLARLGYDNVQVKHGDGTEGWEAHAPYDAIVVAAGGPDVPDSLKAQLEIGGRLVMPIGVSPRLQKLVKLTRIAAAEYAEEDIVDVRFVPLIGAHGWGGNGDSLPLRKFPHIVKSVDIDVVNAIDRTAKTIESVETANLDGLLQRIDDARVVLLGEATHGTSEFYRMRARITRELIERKRCDFVAIEGDWPDTARIDHYVRHREQQPAEWSSFARFPTWMWRNTDVRDFVDWLHERNANVEPSARVAFHGLDLYSMYTSIHSILEYLQDVDPDTAAVARERYGCLTPYQSDPATYGRAALTSAYHSCQEEVTRMLGDLLQKRWDYAARDGERFMDAVQNARLITNAERYYRAIYYGAAESWNLRDTHMFDTLQALLAYYGPDSKAVIWAHNSHIGDARVTEMSRRGEYNIGQLCQEHYGERCYSIGFGTDHGSVAAASQWDGEMEIKRVRPALEESYEHLFHQTGRPGLSLALEDPSAAQLSEMLRESRLERAIGVIYRPETELASHYFKAVLPRQFNEYIWLDETHAVTPLSTQELAGLPDTYPFGL